MHCVLQSAAVPVETHVHDFNQSRHWHLAACDQFDTMQGRGIFKRQALAGATAPMQKLVELNITSLGAI